ncbi:MAG: cytochrome b/b6 domain-containing protein [Candidatus Sedimenticola sp. 4PFRAG1]
MENETEVKIWDPLVRFFHWALVLAFCIAYITEDDFLSLHVYAGYFICGLILVRLIWGLVGTRHARFSSFVKKPDEVIAYLKDVIAFRAKRHLGHNPAGGAMVVALLLMLVITLVTGIAAYGAEQLSGPLAGVMANLPYFVGKAFEEIHEFCANFTLLLVALHLLGVAFASLQHGENLVRAMVTGRKQTD